MNDSVSHRPSQARWLVGTASRRLIASLDWCSVAAFSLPLALYMLTLAPTIYNLDSAELTTAAATGGIIRATGYPLYLAIGRFWSLLPAGDVGYRMNLLSAVCGAVTLLLAERSLRRLDVGPWARLGALGLLAAAPYFWALSLVAEVYTLHTALMAGVILLLLRWGESPTPLNLAWPVLLMTLSLGNHAATVLLVPGCVWYVVSHHPRQLARPRVWLAVAAAVVVGASIFLELPLRYSGRPAFNYAGHYDASGTFVPVNLQTLDGILWLVTGRSFAGQMFGYSLPEVAGEAWQAAMQLWQTFFAVGIGPALLGSAVLLRRDWRLGGMLLLMFLANVVFYVNYRVVDKATMFLPVYLVWAIWLGVGYQALINWSKQGTRETTSSTLPWLVRGVVAGAVALAVSWNWPLVDLSDDWSTREQSEAILLQVEPNALILGWWDTIPGIQYLQLVEGQRPDVTAVNRFLIGGEEMNQLIWQEIGRRPVYINNPSVELLRRAEVTAVNPFLYRVEPRLDGTHQPGSAEPIK
jgi:hypothetical protein